VQTKVDCVTRHGLTIGMFSAFAAFLDDGDEVIVMEPYFDQVCPSESQSADTKYISNIEMNGGKIVYVPIRPPVAKKTHSASEWTLDIEELKSKCTDKTKMIVLNTPHNPLGKMFSKEELEAIGKVAIENDLLIVSDEVVLPLFQPCLIYLVRPAGLSSSSSYRYVFSRVIESHDHGWISREDLRVHRMENRMVDWRATSH
jgi:kynurenine aminotransferase